MRAAVGKGIAVSSAPCRESAADSAACEQMQPGKVTGPGSGAP